ncbi:unnamed protein product [Linum tenue]|uniref:Nitrate regulatory gene2 protein-like n=1 Tax=Linum tenue TaxID=586396 RepID=A0AAV0KN34_9ROSI|nr:unnamed protein product [Linum tenue]
MGCSQSKIENEEAVTRCKERKQFMKDAVSARNAFAAAHSAYAMSLKNTGAALSDFAHGEVPPAPPPPQAPFDTLLPPPPLPTEYQGTPNFQGTPLQRAASMPEMKILKPEMKQPVGPTIIEDEEMEFEPPEEEKLVRKRGGSRSTGSSNHYMEKEPPMPPPQQQAVPQRRRQSLMQIFGELDNHFLAAYESAHGVSKMLEATRLHYHSNFADNRGHIDHSARVMRVITWNRSFKGIPNVYDGNDDFDSEEHETLATVLDKMLAWEKKLYDEVKAGEVMKFEYQKKVALLNKQKKRGSNPESLEKLKAAVSHLHTRYIVDMQSMDSTVLEINRLRDDQLYPKLVQLVDGMAIMWDAMRVHHEAQSKIVYALRSLDISQSPKETSEHHHDRTYQLWAVVREWHAQFCGLIDNQKAYIKSLNSWLKQNLVPIESSLKEKVSSPPRIQTPPVQPLLMAWHDYMDKLPDEVARTAISNFAAVIETIMHHQEEEMKLKEKCEETRKDLARKTRQFEDWYNKYMQKRTPEELDPERPENNIKEAIAERQFTVDAVKKQLEEEEEAYQRLCLQVREKSLASLKTRLPELFRAMCDFSLACSEMYRTLRAISHRQKRPSNQS